MDAITYIKEAMRMCKSAGDNCEHCPARSGKFCPISLCSTTMNEMYGNEEKAVSIVEQWAKDHPVKTRQSEFLKMFPNAKTDENGILIFCPRKFDPENINSVHCHRHGCVECRNDYWNEEVTDND